MSRLPENGKRRPLNEGTGAETTTDQSVELEVDSSAPVSQSAVQAWRRERQAEKLAVGCDGGDHLVHVTVPEGVRICAKCVRRANGGAS